MTIFGHIFGPHRTPRVTGGFTLIELLIYVGLSSILIAIMSQLFLAVLSVRLESKHTTGVQQDGRFILTRLSHDIRRAQSAVAPLLGQTQSGLTLRVNENGVLQTYAYAVSGSDLMLTTGTDSVKLNGTDSVVRVFSVQRSGNSDSLATAKDTFTIHLVMEGRSDVSVGQQTLDLTTTVGMR